MTTENANERPRYLRRHEAAAYLNVSVSFLEKLAHQKTGPRFIKSSRRMTLYDPADLDAWTATKMVEPIE